MPMINWTLRDIASSACFARCLLLVFTVIAMGLACASCGHSPPVLVAFRTEQQAQQHCPGDTVVWLDIQNAAYYVKGHGSYGGAPGGRYACRGEADAAGLQEIK
jgi:hypothetical protein